MAMSDLGKMRDALDEDPARHRVAAEALLALRRMRRLDEPTYIDDTLITQAEYQLFLDEVRAKGNYFQPDHWLTLQFPEGEGREPVAGVRAADAVAFCDWLTERNAAQWSYRLPTLDEVDQVEMIHNVIGYWASGQSGEFVLAGATAPAKMINIIGQQITIDRDRGFALALDRALAFHYVLMLEFYMDAEFDLDRAHKPDRTHALDLDQAFALNQALDLALDQALDQALAHAYTRIQSRDRALALALDYDLDLNRALDLNQALYRTFDHTLTLDPDHALKHILDFDHNLDRARELIRHRDWPSIVDKVQPVTDQWPEVADFLWWYTRLLTLTIGTLLHFYSNEKALGETYLDSYVDFVILHKRMQGYLPALEGIRIVREWKERD